MLPPTLNEIAVLLGCPVAIPVTHPAMSTVRCVNLKILRSVVRRITVDVVDNFTESQWTPKRPASDKAMLIDEAI